MTGRECNGCFIFNDTATTEIYTLSLHDALPISSSSVARTSTTSDVRLSDRDARDHCTDPTTPPASATTRAARVDRKSTRLNSSHANISYAVFCLKKKKLF